MFNINGQLIDLNSLPGLQELDKRFYSYILAEASDLAEDLKYYREIGIANLQEVTYSAFIIKLGPLVDDFIADLFQINADNIEQKKSYKKFDVLYEVRRKFVQRYIIKKYSRVDIEKLSFKQVSHQLELLIGNITQKGLAKAIINWQINSDKYQKELAIVAQYCAIMYYNNSSLELFNVPRPVSEDNYIRQHKIEQLSQKTYIGFDYRDHIASEEAAMHTKYCIYCHTQGKDSCSKGLHKSNPRKYPSKEKPGCPLKQKISEMNFLKDRGFNIAALAAIVIDNPMVAATGHRICNDCMKSCIYQKQEPVNVPLIETDILNQVLKLPWGVEIYILLTKWNPLNIDAPLPKKTSGYNILVTGLGPAGFSLSHYLINEGHNVIAIDGLKISPLHFDSSKPIKYWEKIKHKLSDRKPQGFGGVAEYGITNRWDKNNLTLIRLILARRQLFTMHGGIRLGSNITIQDAFSLGFDHIALCLGAGKPKYLSNSSFFAKNIKSATDFLMNLQQGVPYQKHSNSNMQIFLPAVVIGCGLTAIDSAVELIHYYPLQVMKFAEKWKTIDHSTLILTVEERQVAVEYLAHAKLFDQAKNHKETLAIIKKLGGVTICYRKNIQESPAYKLNHEEIEHALAIGVNFIEDNTPKNININQFGAVKTITISNNKTIPAKTILLAIGNNKNKFIDIDGIDNSKSEIFKNKNCNISYFGDCNQKYTGSVVKALASAKNGYKAISKYLTTSVPKSLETIKFNVDSVVQNTKTITDNIVEITIYSSLPINNIEAGQFFRLQNNSDCLSKQVEPIALTPINIDYKNQLLTFIIKNVGKSSNLIRKLKIGEKITLMGPTGSPTKILSNKNILLIGSDIGNILLLPIMQKLKTTNCKTNFISLYQQESDLIYSKRIDQLSDNVIRYFNKDEYTSQVVLELLNKAKADGLLANIDHIYCNADSKLVNLLLEYKPQFFPGVEITYMLNIPMQCMMKGVCGQCIQPINNGDSYIFVCHNQHVNAEDINFSNLNNRFSQNSLFEKIFAN